MKRLRLSATLCVGHIQSCSAVEMKSKPLCIAFVNCRGVSAVTSLNVVGYALYFYYRCCQYSVVLVLTDCQSSFLENS